MATATALTVTQGAALTPPRAEVSPVIDTDVNLSAASVANIPLNLLIDLINIPNAEWQATDVLAQAQLWGGNWWVTGPSNIWGTDPADAVRFMALAAMLIPIPALSGLNPDAPLDADHPLGVLAGNGLAQMFWRFMAAELPVDPSCDAEGCVPTIPAAPITGITGIDKTIWNVMMFTGMVRFPVIAGFFRVALSELINGSYGPVEDPSGKVYDVPGFNLPGTIDGPNGENFLPWAGMPIGLNLVAPFANYLTHLMADPADNPIKLPSLEQLGRTLQTLLAGLIVGFDFYTPGSPLCPAHCPDLPASQDYPAIARIIGNLWPGNTKIDAWLAAYDQGIANTPTGVYIARNLELFRLGDAFWDFSNKPLDPRFLNIGFNPSNLAPAFYNMWKMLGFHPDPLYPNGNTTGVPTPAGTVMYAAKSVQSGGFPSVKASDQGNGPAATDLPHPQSSADITTPSGATGQGGSGEGAPPITTDEAGTDTTGGESGTGDATVAVADSSTEHSRDDGDGALDRPGDEGAGVGGDDEKDSSTSTSTSTASSSQTATADDPGAAGAGETAKNGSTAGSDETGSGTHAKDDNSGDGGGSDGQAS